MLDEPTNHLDVHYQWLLMEVIAGLKKTVLSVFHELNLACAFCDYLFVLKDGRIAAQGMPRRSAPRKCWRKYSACARTYLRWRMAAPTSSIGAASGEQADRAGRAAEDYLEALLLLEQEQGEAHGAQLARRMGISRASVSITMKQLRQNGYITVDKGHRLCLTDAGRAIASMNAIAFLPKCSFAQASALPPRSGTPAGWSMPSARRVLPGLKNS